MLSLEHLGIIIFLILMFIVGVVLVFWAGRRLWFAWRSSHWSHAVGVITRSEVVEDKDDGICFTPHVEYSFEVAGRRITGSTLMLGFLTERFGTRVQAEKRSAEFPVGAAVCVFHHPDRPNECVLQIKVELGVYAFLIFGSVLAVSAIWILLEAVVR